MKWLSQKNDPMGGMSSRGYLNILGRPSLDPLIVMIRESVQNSWDAKKSKSDFIDYTLYVNRYTNEEKNFLKQKIFNQPLKEIPNLEKIDDFNNYFLIEDKNTDGLTGPVIATEKKIGQDSDYVDFILDFGAPRDKDFGGGTYGYGKTAFHKVSKIQTIFVFTKTIFQGKLSTRFIGYCIGEANETNNGRCWFGMPDHNNNLVLPLLDNEAKEVARKLGFKNVDDESTGTSIMVPFPEMGSFSERDTLKNRNDYECFIFMLSAIYWNLWPKMINFNDENQPPINFKAFFHDKKFDLFHPNEHPLLSNFVQSYFNYFELSKDKKKVKSEKNLISEFIRHSGLKKDIGILSAFGHPEIDKNLSKENDFKYDLMKSIFETSPNKKDNDIKSHHIALMRSTELVIKYHEGPENVESNYSGVFIANRSQDIDDAFAESEPPTHDDWSIDQLQGDQKKIVRHTFNQIKIKINEMINIDTFDDSAENEFDTVLDLAYHFGNILMPLSSGVAPAKDIKIKPPKQTIKKKSIDGFINISKNPLIEKNDGKKIFKISFTPNIINKNKIFNLITSVNTCIENNSIELSGPNNSKEPKFLFWLNENNQKIEKKDCPIDHRSSGTNWIVAYEVPNNISISVDVNLS